MFNTINKLLKKEQGFTLIELMVVVIIIGILAAVAIPQFAKQTDKAKKASAESDLRNWGTAIELYYMDNNAWPKESSQDDGNTVELNEMFNDNQDYFDSNLPTNDPWNEPYQYTKPVDSEKSLPKANLYSTGIGGDTIYWKQ